MKNILKPVLTWVVVISLLVPIGLYAGAGERVRAEEDIVWGFLVLGDKTASITGCSDITGKVVIPEKLGNYTVTGINDNAFYGGTNMTEVVMPESITNIGNNAFYGCTGLTDITIPKNVARIGSSVLAGCTALKSIVVDSENRKFDSRGGCNAIIQTGTDTLIAGCAYTEIPEGILGIGNGAFAGYTEIEDIELPNSVMSIGSSAFADCTELKRISIPDMVTFIGSNAFKNCGNLKIYTSRDSYAAQYAEKNNILVWYRGEPEPTPAPTLQPTDTPEPTIQPTATPVSTPEATQKPTETPKETMAPTETPKETEAPTVTPEETITPTETPGADTPTAGPVTPTKQPAPVQTPSADSSSSEPASPINVGYKYTYKGAVYTVTSIKEEKQTAKYLSFDNRKASRAVVPATINIDGTVYKVTEIANNAYKGCGRLKKITVGKNVIKIGKNAFAGCGKLRNIVIKSKVLKKVGKKALSGINSRAVVKVPKKKYKVYMKLFKKAGMPKGGKIK